MMEEQLVGMLEAVQEVTPEIASQAVAYGRWLDIIWIGILLLVVAIIVKIFRFSKKRLDDDTDYVITTIVCGFAFAISLLAIVGVTADLIGSYIAPDYYAAEAVIRMFRLGVH